MEDEKGRMLGRGTRRQGRPDEHDGLEAISAGLARPLRVLQGTLRPDWVLLFLSVGRLVVIARHLGGDTNRGAELEAKGRPGGA